MNRLIENKMEKPSLEEVKEHFKNAKTVKCLSSDYYDYVYKESDVGYGHECIYIDTYKVNGGKGCCIIFDTKEGYAEIVEYKDSVLEELPGVISSKSIIQAAIKAAKEYQNKKEACILEELPDIIAPEHYDNSKGTLYKFCEEKGLNSYEFDIIKRVMRCRKKGAFLEDLRKTKVLIDLYIQEHGKK